MASFTGLLLWPAANGRCSVFGNRGLVTYYVTMGFCTGTVSATRLCAEGGYSGVGENSGARSGSAPGTAPTLRDPGENVQGALGVGLRGAADEEFVDALSRQTEFPRQEGFLAALPEHGAHGLHELVP